MKNTSLILAGGGAKGAYQAEVASRIYENRNIDSVIGVSAGALNGALISQGKTERIRNLWPKVRRSDVWESGIWQTFQLLLGNRKGFFDPSPLIGILNREFNPTDVEVPFLAGATSVKTGDFKSFKFSPNEKKQNGHKLVAASSAVPALVEPVEAQGKLYADGGIRNVAPIRTALEEGADEIIAVLNSRLGEAPSRPKNALDMLTWAFESLMDEALRSDIGTARTINRFAKRAKELKQIEISVASPSEDLGSPIDFSRKAQKRRQEIGRKDAKKFLQT